MANLDRRPGLHIQTPIGRELRLINDTYFVDKNGEVKWRISNEKIAAGVIGTIGFIAIAALDLFVAANPKK